MGEIFSNIKELLSGEKNVTVNVGIDNTAIFKLVGCILGAGVILILLNKAVK
jgi:hypothetical protein